MLYKNKNINLIHLKYIMVARKGQISFLSKKLLGELFFGAKEKI